MVICINGDRKLNFSKTKTFSIVEIFEKAPFSCFHVDDKNGTFENDDVIASDLATDKNVSLPTCLFEVFMTGKCPRTSSVEFLLPPDSTEVHEALQ